MVGRSVRRKEVAEVQLSSPDPHSVYRREGAAAQPGFRRFARAMDCTDRTQAPSGVRRRGQDTRAGPRERPREHSDDTLTRGINPLGRQDRHCETRERVHRHRVFQPLYMRTGSFHSGAVRGVPTISPSVVAMMHPIFLSMYFSYFLAFHCNYGVAFCKVADQPVKVGPPTLVQAVTQFKRALAYQDKKHTKSRHELHSWSTSWNWPIRRTCLVRTRAVICARASTARAISEMSERTYVPPWHSTAVRTQRPTKDQTTCQGFHSSHVEEPILSKHVPSIMDRMAGVAVRRWARRLLDRESYVRYPQGRKTHRQDQIQAVHGRRPNSDAPPPPAGAPLPPSPLTVMPNGCKHFFDNQN